VAQESGGDEADAGIAIVFRTHRGDEFEQGAS
jgi:hypothetical protein